MADALLTADAATLRERAERLRLLWKFASYGNADESSEIFSALESGALALEGLAMLTASAAGIPGGWIVNELGDLERIRYATDHQTPLAALAHAAHQEKKR